MKKKLFILLAFLVGSHLASIGQPLPIKNVPSPEIAGLGEFGKVPVSLFTGVPDISVPLHEVSAGNYSLSVSAAYHLASVKPHIQPGCLGMGWNLVAGGYITRSVHGLYDEKCHSNGYAPGYYANAYRLKGMSNDVFVEATRHIQDMEEKYYELSADEFSFSFCGYSGNFYYSEDGGWNVVSDQDIQVEFNPANGVGFINSNQLGERIPLNGWGAVELNNRFFNKFTLITPDGCRYEFGGLQATEYSIPYYSRKDSELIPTTWRLSKITTVDKRVIEFTYDTSSIMCDLRYIPQQKIVTGIACTPSSPQRGQSGMTGYLIFPVNIKAIKTPSETLQFNYYEDCSYSGSFVDTYLGWGELTTYDRKDLYSISENPAYQFQLLLGNGISTSSEYELREGIKSKLKSKVLHSIYIKGAENRSLKTIYFDYTYSNRRKLSLITERSGNPAVIPEYAWHPHGYYFLTGYKVPQLPRIGSVPEYHFKYHSPSTMPTDYIRAKVDSWGYYAGGITSFTSMPSFEKKVPLLMHTQEETLEEITYPTGGKSRFEYSLNRYSKVVNPSHTSLNSQLGTAGGLRIERVTQLSREDSILGVKQYYYTDTKTERGESSGILRNSPLYEIAYTLSAGVNLILRSEGSFFAEVTNLNSPDVGYSCVTEETLDKYGKSQGYIIRRFSNYDEDIYGATHYDESSTYSTITGESYVKPFTSRGMERGKLLAEEYYDENDKPRKKINYKYKTVNPGSFVTAQQTLLMFCSDPDDYFVSNAMGTLTKTYTHAYLVDSIIETLHTEPGNATFTKKQVHEYNKYKQLKKVSGKTSDGKDFFTSYTYAADAFGTPWMRDQHLLSPIVRKREQTGRDFKEVSYEYEQSQTGIPYIKAAKETMNGHIQKPYTVNLTDDYGNPVEIEERGMPIVLIWGGKGQRIIARIENVTYDRMRKLVNIEDFSSLEMSSIDYRKIENIRHKILESHFYIYKYNDNFRLESETLPNGTTTFYKYDFLGRLKETYFFDQKDGYRQKRTSNMYDYHYYNSNPPSDTGDVMQPIL